MKKAVFITHNPITRLLASSIWLYLDRRCFFNIETRPTPESIGKRAISNRLLASPATNYTVDQIIGATRFISMLASRLKSIDEFDQPIDLIIPHFNNDLFLLFAEHPGFQRVWLIEEGDASRKANKSTIKRHHELVAESQEYEKRFSNAELAIIKSSLLKEGYRRESFDILLRAKGSCFPAFIDHRKLKLSLHISEDSFLGYQGRKNIRHILTHIETPSYCSLFCIVYLPSAHTKFPSWVTKMCDKVKDYFLSSVVDALSNIDISGCVLRPHPSTPDQLVSAAKKAIGKRTRVMLWEEFSQDLSDGDLVEPAALKFGYALFTCQTSAIHYTRVFSPDTQILYAYNLEG